MNQPAASAADILQGLPTTIAGYDLAEERRRVERVGKRIFPDVTAGGIALNRATARIDVLGDMNDPRHEKVRDEHVRAIFTTTHQADSPVIELGYPTAGPYVACGAGVYMDCVLGVAQKLLDEHHPAFRRAVEALVRHHLLFRREINTDDYFTVAPFAGDVHTPQALARLLASLAEDAFPIVPHYKVFFSNSGTEAIEAAIKLAQLVRYRRLIERYSPEPFYRLMASLGIPRNEVIERWDRTKAEPVYRDYPFFLFAFEGAFHGRTLGALSLTQSKKAHQLGYSKLQWVRHFRWNAAAAEVEEAIDPRGLLDIERDEGPSGVRSVLARGRVPKDLVAGFVAEPFQGEGGYRAAEPRAFRELGAVLKRFEVPFILDEVQTFGRTGTAFAARHLLNEPDIIAIAKGAVVGATLARAELERFLHPGWHSNTWGGGKAFDTQLAYATIDALVHYHDPALDGLRYFDNCRVKGQYLDILLERLRQRHPEVLLEHSGLGLLHGITVRRRDDVIAEAWRQGIKLLGCGLPGEAARVRLVFLADTLARELDDFAFHLDHVLAAVAAKRKDVARAPGAGAGAAPADGAPGAGSGDGGVPGTGTDRGSGSEKGAGTGVRSAGLAVTAAAFLLLGGEGCGDDPHSKPAPIEYVENVIQARDHARARMREAEARTKLGQFQAMQGRSPRDLGELAPPAAPFGFRWEYDPQDVTIALVETDDR